MSLQSSILVIDGFRASKLNNERKLFVYLPPSYEGSVSYNYPVLYMHAGQRAFDPLQPGTESWRIHHAADRLIREGAMDEIIIVAIAHVRPVHSNEYYHFTAPAAEAESIACSGLDYEDFIINEVKPYIDSEFRTLQGPENTGLIGSSAGGLATYHMGFRHPDVFGKLIMLSPYFIKAQLDDESETGLYEEVLYRSYALQGKRPLKVWMDIGDSEGLFLPRHVRDVASSLMDQGFRYGEELGYLEQLDAAHQETDWGDRVHIPLLFMFGRIGTPISLAFNGRNQVGLSGGMSVYINPILRYDSGFALSVLNGTYYVDNPDVLEVRPDGQLIPKGLGKTNVTLTAGGLVVSGTYTVIQELSDCVSVSFHVEVPTEASPAPEIFGGMGMRLSRTDSNLFTGQFKVPRDSGYRFRFTKGFRNFESNIEGHVIPNRVFRASIDMVLHYKVENWERSVIPSTERRSHASPTF